MADLRREFALPPEDVAEQTGQVRHGGGGRAVEADLLDPVEEPAVLRDDVAVQVSLGRDQRRRGDDQAGRLQVADPFLVGAEPDFDSCLGIVVIPRPSEGGASQRARTIADRSS